MFSLANTAMNARIPRIVGSTQLLPARTTGHAGAPVAKYARRCLLALAVVFATIGVGETAAQTAGANSEKPDLFYFVVDRSASMKDKKLVEPVSGAVIEFLGRAPAGCEVRLIFFGSVATKHWQWRNVGTKEKSTIYNEFRRNFVPEGDTRLYDTVAEALKAIIPHADQYRQIQLIVLTDGDDTRSKDYRSWESLAGLAGPLVGDHPNSLLTVYTLGFTPKDKPGAPWQHVPVANVTGNFKLQQPRPNARFLLSPGQAAVGEPILFVLMSEVGVESVQWNFGDGEGATTTKPTHRYQKVGTYKVTATATGSGGEDSQSVTVSVLDKVPIAGPLRVVPAHSARRTGHQFAGPLLRQSIFASVVHCWAACANESRRNRPVQSTGAGDNRTKFGNWHRALHDQPNLHGAPPAAQRGLRRDPADGGRWANHHDDRPLDIGWLGPHLGDRQRPDSEGAETDMEGGPGRADRDYPHG